MKRKVIVEINPEAEEEIIIRCKEYSPEIEKLRLLCENGPDNSDRIMLQINGRDYIVRYENVLFFESYDDKTVCHTKDRMYYSSKTLRDLEQSLPQFFARISKSCILNIEHVESLSRSLTGVCEVTLDEGNAVLYASRMYYQGFIEKLRTSDNKKG